MKNSKTLYFSNETENPELKKLPCADCYTDDLAEIIALALDPIERFIAYMDNAANEKTQREQDSISILYALHKNATAILNRFDDDLTRHAGDVSVLRYCYQNSKGESPEKAFGVEIMQTTNDKEATS